MDALEELKKALEQHTVRRRNSGIFDNGLWDSDANTLGRLAARYLPTLIAELEARRAAMGDDVNPAGFSVRATLELK